MKIQGTIPTNSSRIFLLLVMVLAITSCSSDSTRDQIPTAKAGIIDLTKWNFVSDGILPLDGDWEIYWNQLIEPEEFRQSDFSGRKDYIEVPAYWNNKILGGEKAKGKGYATFRLNVQLGSQDELYQIRIIQLHTAYRAWVNGELVATEGTVGKSADAASPEFGLKEITIPVKSDSLEIILHISNFHDHKGGFRRSILIGNPEQISSYGKTRLGYDHIVITILFIVSLFILWLFIYNPKDRAPLYVALVCFCSAVNFSIVNELILLQYFKGISWEIFMKIDFISNYLRAAFFIAFFRNFYPQELSRIFSRGMLIWAAIFSLFTLFTKAAVYSATFIQFEIVVGIAIVYLIYGLVMALIRRRKGAFLSAIGISVLMASAVNDILHNEMIINTGFFFPMGLLICIFSLSFLISRNFARLYNSVVRLSRRLVSLDKIKNAFIRNTSKYNLENPFKAILENANADKGFIYIWEESSWVLKVFLSFDKMDILKPSPNVKDFSATPTDNSSFPYALIRKSIATEQNIVLHNAVEEEQFQDDPYIRKCNAKSAFCMRIISQDKLIGLLYLENQNIEGAFNKEKLEMLDLLSPQLTTMLDNIEIFRQLELLNRNLEQKVEERTTELIRQKQNLEVANQKINDSINYARHIQDSILLPEEEIKESLTDFFIYNRPRELVSGDFYWFSKVKNIMVIAAIDCTGHGIPGAFMSMIGHTLVNDIVNGMNILKPSQILKYLNRGVKELLHQNSAEAHAQDGMDLALCTIDPDKRVLQYCGARNPLYLVRDKKLEVIKADPWSVGGRKKRFGIDKEVEFTNHMINLDQPVSVYMLTDGYLDQFGEEGEEKFNLDRFRKLLVEISDKPMNEQKLILAQTMEEWKGSQRQIDDMLIIGIHL